MAQLQQGERIAACPPSIYPPELFTHQSRILAQRGPDQIFFCDNLEIVYTLVEAGYAFAVLPDLPLARMPGLRYIPVSDIPPLSFGAVCAAGEQSPALRAFLAALRRSISG